MILRNLKMLILGLLGFILLGYQNCSPSADTIEQPNNPYALAGGSSSPVTENQGNGGGYTGKLTITAPHSIEPNQSYVVNIFGGVAPYTIQSPQGMVSIVKTTGTAYEIMNNFSSNANSFQLIVTDSEGSMASTTIDIVETDNIYNYSSTNSLAIYQNKIFLYDQKLRKIIVFDPQGVPEGLLSPKGDLFSSFSSTDVRLDAGDFGTVVLEPDGYRLSLYDSFHQFVKEVNLANLFPNHYFVNFTVHNNHIYLVDSAKDSVQILNFNGDHVGVLDLDFQGYDPVSLRAIAFDPNIDRLYLADREGGVILVFEQKLLMKTIAQTRLPDGRTHLFRGLDELKIGEQGELFVADTLFNYGPKSSAAGVNPYLGTNEAVKGETWIFRLEYQPGVDIHDATDLKYTEHSKYYNPTNCLDVDAAVVSFCNFKRQPMLREYDGTPIAIITPREGGFGTGVSSPRYIAVDDEGSYFISSDYNVLVSISADQKILFRKNRYGPNNQMIGTIRGIEVVGETLFLSIPDEKKVKAFNKRDMSFLFEFTPVNDQGNSLRPGEIAATNSHLAIIVPNTGIVLYDFQGQRIRMIDRMNSENGEMTSFLGIKAINANSNGQIVFFSDRGNIVYLYDINTNFVKSVTSFRFNVVNSMAIDEKAEVIYLNKDSSVHLFDTISGSPIGVIGAPGTTAGLFNKITGVAITDKSLFVCDFYNSRVQRFTNSFTFTP